MRDCSVPSGERRPPSRFAFAETHRGDDSAGTRVGHSQERHRHREGMGRRIDPRRQAGDHRRRCYKRQFRSFIQRHNLPDLLVSLAPKPVPGDIEALLAVRPTFVRQLEIIEAAGRNVLRVSDYLRTSADKTMWAEQGLLYVLEQARHERRPSAGSGLVCHSDRSSHYVSIRYTERLTEPATEMSVKPNVRFCARWRFGMT